MTIKVSFIREPFEDGEKSPAEFAYLQKTCEICQKDFLMGKTFNFILDLGNSIRYHMHICKGCHDGDNESMKEKVIMLYEIRWRL